MTQPPLKRCKILLAALSIFLTAALTACNEATQESDQEQSGDALTTPIFAPKKSNSAIKTAAKLVFKKGAKSGIMAGGLSRGISYGQTAGIVSGTSLTGAFAGTFNPLLYTRAVQERVKENWQPAPAIATKFGVVTFNIDHTGSISNLLVKEPSGSADFDHAMLVAIEKAVPMPPLVASAPAKVFIEFTFDERLLRGTPSKDDLKKIVDEQSAAIKQKADDYQAYSLRGRAYRRLGQYDKAIADWGTVIAGTEEKLPAYIERAYCYLYIDDYKSALNDSQECLKLAPDLATPYCLEASALLGLGHLSEAERALNIALALRPGDPESWALRANCDNLALKHKEAVADAGRAIALDPEYGSAYAYRGDAYEALKDYDNALRDYTKNVELDPKESQSYLRRTELYTKLGQYDKAVFDATQAIRLSPQNGEAYYYRAHANEQLGLKAQAQKDLARAKQLGQSVF